MPAIWEQIYASVADGGETRAAYGVALTERCYQKVHLADRFDSF
jgi:hypothetical protein